MKKPKMLAVPVFLVMFIGVALFGKPGPEHTISTDLGGALAGDTSRVEQSTPATAALGDAQVVQAVQRRQSDVQVRGSAIVSRVLPDDNEGSRHQRFILQLSTGGTLLIAHNIDLAPRIPSLQVGDLVDFYGEYEWNDKGGVVHWTHHDPGGRHVGGWLKHNGRTYQ